MIPFDWIRFEIKQKHHPALHHMCDPMKTMAFVSVVVTIHKLIIYTYIVLKRTLVGQDVILFSLDNGLAFNI